jgi:hypothetical protein
MSMRAVAKAVRDLEATAVEALWAQWLAVGAPGTGDLVARSLIDPEALVLGSICLSSHERRLHRFVTWWAATGPTLLSISRVKNLLASFPEQTQERVAGFARTAAAHGKDARWKTLVRSGAPDEPRKKDLASAPRFFPPAALPFRLRLGLGVGIKADVMSYLLGTMGTGSSVRTISRSVDYSERAVRRGVEELVAARFVRARPTVPITYNVAFEPWSGALELDPDKAPAWRPWRAVYSFVCQLSDWRAAIAADTVTSYIMSSQARSLVESNLEAFAFRPSSLDDRARYHGEEFLTVFLAGLGELDEWIRRCV